MRRKRVRGGFLTIFNTCPFLLRNLGMAKLLYSIYIVIINVIHHICLCGIYEYGLNENTAVSDRAKCVVFDRLSIENTHLNFKRFIIP